MGRRHARSPWARGPVSRAGPLLRACIAAWVLASVLAWAPGARAGEASAQQPEIALGMPVDLAADYPPGTRYMGVRLLGTLRLDGVSVSGRHVLHSLSALGYDEDADLLYALSDRGVLFHLRLEFDHDMLTQAWALAAYPLLDTRGAPLRGVLADAEGLTLRNERNAVQGDTEVLVSFERRPRVIVFDTHGVPTGAVALPPPLGERDAYRNGNKSLEAVTMHPRFGVLVGAEQPMLSAPQDQVQIHAVEAGMMWHYNQPHEPNHALVGLEALPDGGLLTLERAYGFMFVPFITLLRQFPPLSRDTLQLGDGHVVARFSTGQGFAIDNFEGLARHRGRRFLIVSDDNGRPFQATLLSYFELTGETDPAAGGATLPASRAH